MRSITGGGLERPGTGAVDVAGEEEHPGGAVRRLPRQDECGVGAIAPADEGRLGHAKRIHDGASVGCHEFVAVRPRVAGRTALATAVDHDGLVPCPDQRWNLVAPITRVPQATVQQHHRRSRPDAGVPDAGVLVIDISAHSLRRKGRNAMRREMDQIVVVEWGWPWWELNRLASSYVRKHMSRGRPFLQS